ncbi:DNA excision repair protein-like protein [Xylogone sp. PMI_703]|nr:DNA excision repair protein-like protein [Xylogone sp. PMI_703]
MEGRTAAEEYILTTDEEDLDAGVGGRGASMNADQYIEKVVGSFSTEESDSEVEITNVKVTSQSKGKRKAGEKIEWSADEDEDDPYQKFKNRKSAKRKKTAAAKKKLKAKINDAVARRKEAKENGKESSKKDKEWGHDSDYEMMEEALPEYLVSRKKEFDRNYEILHEAGLSLPPQYDDIEFSDDEHLADLEERPNFSETVELSRPYKDIELPISAGVIPASIAQYLRDYQVDGVAFLHELFVYQKGGILGDDMGLGKTVQVAAFLTVAFGKTGDERDAKRMRKMRRAAKDLWYPQVLIVCPGSLIQNWMNELNRWGWWHVDKFHGDTKDEVFEAAKAGRLEIVITTYHTYRDHRSRLNLIAWDCVIADECHMMKERSSETTKSMNEVNALCRIGLTGTAIQNKYEELWTLLNWTNPGRFGPLSTWQSSISEPLKIGQSHDATMYQLSLARRTAKKLRDNLLPEFFLRRMKTLIAHQLPKKTDTVVFCPLTEIQRDAYETFLEGEMVDYVKHSSDPCSCGSGKKAGWCCKTMLPDSNTKWQALVFPVIVTLQKLSNHLALLIPNSADPQEKQQRDLEFLQEMVPTRWKELYSKRDSLFNLSNPEFCGKWKVLKRLLRFWHGNGDKVLIFSHSVRLLKMLQHLFHNTSYNVSFLDGSMANEDRQRVVDDFNTDPGQFVFLISTKAGGIGLNITSANKVVIFDPNWNPSYDLQAQDRAYRIGQVRDVEVFRLISAGTVEEIVYARQIYKQQQANIGYNASLERRYFKGVQSVPGQQGEIFGLENLLTFHGDNIVLQEIVNKTNVAEAKAGVSLIQVDMDEVMNDNDNPLKTDEDNEDAAMSQLAALLASDASDNSKVSSSSSSKPLQPQSRAKTDVVQAILASAGVTYTHENSEVVGSSRVETHLSRRAEEAGNDADLGEEVLFREYSQRSALAGGASQDILSSTNLSGRIHYKYHPPEDVAMRQFCTMAKTYGFASATDFAFVVEGWTQKQRTNFLERFYLERKERLIQLEIEKRREAEEAERRVEEADTHDENEDGGVIGTTPDDESEDEEDDGL